MLGNRGLVDGNWKAVTYHGRKPWENEAAGASMKTIASLTTADDPAEANDLMADRDRANLDDPMVKKLLELVSMWWAEAGKYQVLPLDDRFFVRALGREALYGERQWMTFYEGVVRIQPFEVPQTLNCSWEMTAEIEVPEGGATGPIVAMAGDSSDGVYLKYWSPSATPSPSERRNIGHPSVAAGPSLSQVRIQKTGPEPSARAAQPASTSGTPLSPRDRLRGHAPSDTPWTRRSTLAGTRAHRSATTTGRTLGSRGARGARRFGLATHPPPRRPELGRTRRSQDCSRTDSAVSSVPNADPRDDKDDSWRFPPGRELSAARLAHVSITNFWSVVVTHSLSRSELQNGQALPSVS